jgi:hypothetical protein
MDAYGLFPGSVGKIFQVLIEMLAPEDSPDAFDFIVDRCSRNIETAARLFDGAF